MRRYRDPMVPRYRPAALALVLTFASVGAACGGGVEVDKVGGQAGGSPAADARVIEVEASNFSFDPDTIQVRAGEEIALTVHSVDSSHDFAVDGLGLVADVAGDETATQRLRIDEAGRFTFYCTIPGHRAGGMEGTITSR